MAFSLWEHIGFTSAQVWCWLAAWMVWSARWGGGYRGWLECGRQSERKGWRAMNWKTADTEKSEEGRKKVKCLVSLILPLAGLWRAEAYHVTGHEAGYTVVSSSHGWQKMANNHWNTQREPRQTWERDAMNVLYLKKGQCWFLCRAQSYNTSAKTFIVYVSTFWPWLWTLYHWSVGPAEQSCILCYSKRLLINNCTVNQI